MHLVFVVEETRRGSRLPEQFVADTVIRLRRTRHNDDIVRVLEIEKCRNRAHMSGSHEFYFRTGGGSFTGEAMNIDHPRIHFLRGKKGRVLPHIFLLQSTEFIDNTIRGDQRPVPQSDGQPEFGIPALDERFEQYTRDGLQTPNHGSVSLILGQTGTLKSRLSRQFLSRALRWKGSKRGKVILLTDALIDSTELLRKLALHFPDATGINIDDVLCRRFGSRYVSSAQFLQIVASYIHKAQADLLGSQVAFGGTLLEFISSEKNLADRGAHSHRIHLVIDDWAQIVARNPAMRTDPFLLPTLLTMLRREGVSALLVSTELHLNSNNDSESDGFGLRSLDVPQIFTWPVDFFGERRTAISTSSHHAFGKYPEIYELRDAYGTGTSEPETLAIDKHFALYVGLQGDKPQRVPLVIRLYGGPHAGQDTPADSGALFPRALTQMLDQLFPAIPDRSVVTFEPFTTYDNYFAFANWLDEARLNHSVIFQIDEFWSENLPSLLDLTQYWKRACVARVEAGDNGNSIRRSVEEDPYDECQPHNDPYQADGICPSAPAITCNYVRKLLSRENISRSDTFYDSGFGAPEGELIDRIPFLWDFGLILARQDLWERAADQTCINVWNALCVENDLIGRGSKPSPSSPVTWCKFLYACKRVAQCAPDESVVPFDVDLNTAESLSCLVLEVWASIADLRQESDANDVAELRTAFHSLRDRRPSARFSLRDLLDRDGQGLYLALLHIVPALGHLRAKAAGVYRASGTSGSAASREWYSTSSSIVRHSESNRYRLLRLPGTHTSRGDWFLACAKGSRSRLLGERAMDILSSRRLGLLRLQDGLGLPVRDVLPDSQIDSLKSAITRYNPNTGKVSWMTYGEICQLGAMTGDSPTLNWLWRSRMRHYATHSFFFRRWLGRLIAEQDDWLPKVELPEGELEAYVKVYPLMSPLRRDYEGKFLPRLKMLISALRDGQM